MIFGKSGNQRRKFNSIYGFFEWKTIESACFLAISIQNSSFFNVASIDPEKKKPTLR